ncbi:MAG: LON peptidase substrate-binding domain-containing protein [Nitrospirota bacterium]
MDLLTLQTIPLFPLPNVVFFPKTFLPLHIFEPRYRAMVQDAAQKDQPIGMVLLKEGWERNYEGAPAVHQIGCAGRIVALDALPDGRFNIVLSGAYRFAIESESKSKAYREAQVRRIGGPAWRRLSDRLRRDLLDAVRRSLERPTVSRELGALTQAVEDPEMLVNLISNELALTEVEKQFLLESATLEQQAKRLMELIRLQGGG